MESINYTIEQNAGVGVAYCFKDVEQLLFQGSLRDTESETISSVSVNWSITGDDLRGDAEIIDKLRQLGDLTVA